jgi:ELWxxDGT repeat protein
VPKLSRLALFLALTVLLMLPLGAAAGTAVLLRDIADDPQANLGSIPSQLTPYRDQVAFVATPSNGPAGVWMSDGTEAGTRLIHAGCPVGTCDSNPGPDILGVANGFLFFAVPIEGQHFQLRLWRTDGTVGGTEPATANEPGVFLEHDLLGAWVVATRGALYFHACPEAARCGLWRSDGTPDGAEFLGTPSRGRPVLAGDRIFAPTPEHLAVYDTRTGIGTVVGGWEGFPYNLTAAGGKLFFMAASADRGTEIWTSDGTAAGTRPLTQFAVPSPFAEAPWIKEIGGLAYFVANDTAHGFELWRSDGTPQGTRRVSDFANFNALRALRPETLALAGGKILFNANASPSDDPAATRLWMSDGRPQSTALFRSLCRPGSCNLPNTARGPLAQIGGQVFFPGENGLWSTDGTLSGTRRFVDRLCTDCLSESVFQPLQGRIVFLDRDAVHDVELWSSNGTAAGTRRLTDMPDGYPLSGPVVAAGGRTFFFGRDRHGDEPWVVDGDGTRLLADIGGSPPGSEVLSFAALDSRAVFLACDGTERALWTSTGIPETTHVLPGTEMPCLGTNPSPRLLTAASHLFYLTQGADHFDQLWSTDGDGAPVQLLHLTSVNDFVLLNNAVVNDRLVLSVRVAGRWTLWRSDGTPQGTAPAVDLPLDVTAVEPLRAAGNEAYFTTAGGSGYELWRTDGTAAGTRKIAANILLGPEVVRLGSAVLLTAYTIGPTGAGDFALWRSDGTAAGTSRLKIFPPTFGPVAEGLTAFQGFLYFFVPDGSSWSLWRTDGTAAGTVPVVQLGDPVIDEEGRFGLTVFAGKLFFAAADGEHGRELWTSDGTAAGTRIVADIYPGTDSSQPVEITAAGGALYFTANDGVHGTELWTSDGTAAGTRLAQDIAPEGSSSPRALTAVGPHLYFTADDGLTGREVWSLPLDFPGCRPSSTRLCLNGGRYQVEASWLTPQIHGNGVAVPLSADTGYFWFFSPSNVEAVVKVLDGQAANGHVWVFFGALSNVEYSITVTDTQTGLTRRYFNPQGQLASVGDTHGFGPLGASAANPEPAVTVAAPSPAPLIAARTDKAAAVPCQPSARRLCLSNNRFAVEVAWKDFQNLEGQGTAVPLTGDTGTFWFFTAANIELVVKVLDGRLTNGKFWVFYGALSNVEYTLTVTDTQTGRMRSYTNPKGRFASVADTDAF